jgi:hypothetical protein
MERRCGDCKYWKHRGKGQGNCNAPRLNVKLQTSNDCYCGEFQPKESEASDGA